ncbi:MAG: enoyl-CoA hydratase/isomerase family protein [Alphaproteobacteria bacterium]|nr:enoyl-CoA hydratase/isomerase family protein [Alphaproteobacteria bacterium]
MDIRTITISGPGKNALGSTLMASLRSQLTDAGGAPVLLTGGGDAFSAGLDLKEVASLDAPAMRDFLDGLEALVVDLFHYPGPVVAAVNGHAIAGGSVLALCCDLIVCTDSPRARIGLNEVAIGLRFPPSTLQCIRFALPPHTQGRVLLGAGLHAPQDALALGLVHELAADPVAVGMDRLAALARHPYAAYARTKADLRDHVGRIGPEEAERFAEEVVPAWTSDTVQQTLQAFLSGRRG